MQARLKNVRISPRKIGLAAKLVRTYKVTKAENVLKFAEKKSCHILRKLINSAAANAVQKGEVLDNLIIKSIFVGDGVTIKRFQPRARGSGYQILKRTSNVLVILDVIDPSIKGEIKQSKGINTKTSLEEEITEGIGKERKIAASKAFEEMSNKSESNNESDETSKELEKKSAKNKKKKEEDEYTIFDEETGGK